MVLKAKIWKFPGKESWLSLIPISSNTETLLAARVETQQPTTFLQDVIFNCVNIFP